MLQHSWSVQAVHCFYYSAFSSQHRSLHWNTTWHLAKHRHPLILSQPTLFRYSKYITVYFLRGKPAIYWGAGGNRKKKCHSPGLNTWFLNSGSCKQWSHSGLSDSSSQGSSVKPADFCTILIPFFSFTDAERSHGELWQTLSQSFFRYTASIKTIQIQASATQTWLLTSKNCNSVQFSLWRRSKLKPRSFLSYRPNQYSPSLKKHTHKMRKNGTSKLLLPCQYLY